MRKTAAFFLEIITDIDPREVKINGKLTSPGIGNLVKQKPKARTEHNPKTSETIKIQGKTIVKFRVANAAKEMALGGR